jgi:nitroreductase
MSLPATASDLLALMRTRRSVRRFLPEPLTEEETGALVDAAASAPSAGNRQAYRLLLVTDRARLAAMEQAVRAEVLRLRATLRADVAPDADAYLENFLHFAAAPLVVAPIHRAAAPDLLAAATATGEASARGDAEALASVAASIENLLLAAHALGLGACWMTGPLVAEAALAPILEVPRGWRISALVPVGRPAETPPPPPRRRPETLVRHL